MYFEDYFEGYGTGAVIPTGMTVAGGTGNSTILGSGTGIDGSQCWQVGFAWRDDAGGVDNVSAFHALNLQSQSPQAQIIEMWNSVVPFTGFNPSKILFHANWEPDQTLSFYAGGGTGFDRLLGNTGAPPTGAKPFAAKINDWFTLQMNVTISQVPAGTTTNHWPVVSAEVAVNGTSLVSDSKVLSEYLIEALPDTQPHVNLPFWNASGTLFDSMSYGSMVAINSNPHLSTSRANRISQVVIEGQELIDNSANRISQLVTELQELPNSSFNRVSQLVIELMIKNQRTGNWRVSES